MGLNIDVSGVPESFANAIIKLLGQIPFSIKETGKVKEDDEVWCVFNAWESRDQRARVEGTFENGRFSVPTTFGGKWYCCKKKGR